MTRFPVEDRTCLACGATFPFRPFPSAIKRGRGRFCSVSCAGHVPLEDRFFSSIGSVNENGCILWAGHVDRSGYGQISEGHTHSKKLSSHRLAYEWFVGPIGEMAVCHRCDNPTCINPAHLFLGTQADNLADMIAKGRQNKGEQHHRAKLKEEAVREIRRLVQDGWQQAAVALRFGVGPNAVGDIMRGITWKHVV